MARVFRPIPSDSIRLLVFDLDGTLVDSAEDLCAAVNATLIHFGRASLPRAVIAGYVGDGVSWLVRRALAGSAAGRRGEAVNGALENGALENGGLENGGLEEHFVESAVSWFLDYYREHKLDNTQAYPGVHRAIEELRRGSVARAMAVLTNKPVGPSVAICDALGLSPFFFRIYGGNSFPTKKPDPAGLRLLMEEAGAAPQETLMIGDSAVDVLTAHGAGTWSVGCGYGLAPHTLREPLPDCIVDSPSEWPEVLHSQQQLHQ
jgi:phosphoglycolate phosphatase